MCIIVQMCSQLFGVFYWDFMNDYPRVYINKTGQNLYSDLPCMSVYP